MMRYLILIDKKFPYDKGEPFLENEIKSYADTVDKVILFPIDIGTESKITRSVPDNVEVHLTSNKSRKSFRIGVAVKSVFSACSKKISNTIEVNGYKKALKRKWFAAYVDNTCKERTVSIIRTLDTYDFEANDEVVVYSYWLYTPAIVSLAVRDYLKRRGINAKVVSRAHRFDIYDDTLPFKKESITAMDAIYPCSDDGTKYLRERYAFAAEKIVTAYLGTIDHGIQQIEGSSSEFVIASCSRITKIKRVERIAESLQLIDTSQISRKIKWIHIGYGDDLGKIQTYCEQNLPGIDVEFKGFLPNEEVYEFYRCQHVDLFINVSSSEGLPVSIMEAISFGMPVIATDVGGTREITLDGYNGRILRKDFQNEELAGYIEDFVNMDEADYTVYREHSRRLWESQYNAQKNYPEYLERLYSRD